MKRTFWFGVGVAAGFALSRKANNVARRATPAGLASNMGDAVRELATAVGAFGADVRAGMSEREQELQQTMRQTTGTRAPAAGDAGYGRHAWSDSARGARARRADD